MRGASDQVSGVLAAINAGAKLLGRARTGTHQYGLGWARLDASGETGSEGVMVIFSSNHLT